MSSNLVEDLFSDTEEPDSKNEGQEQDQEQDQEEDSDSEQEQLKRPVKRAKKRQRNSASIFIEDQARVDDTDDEDDDEEAEDGFEYTEDAPDMEQNSRDKARYRKLDAGRDLEQEEDAQVIAARLKQRYGRSATLGGFRGDLEHVPQTLLIPSVNDPKIWMVKCKPGSEKGIVFNMCRKFLNLEASKKPLHILSCFARDSLKGYIYLEADRQSHVVEAIERMNNVYGSKLHLVPVGEMVDCLRIKAKELDVTLQMWVRVKRGIYGGDLGQVVDIQESGETATIKLIPRLDYSVRDSSLNGGKRKKGTEIRAPQKLFNANDVNKREVTPQQGGFVYQKDLFDKDGYLEKSLVKITSLELKNVNPTLEEITRFSGGAVNENGDDLSILANGNIAKAQDFQTGEKVLVLSGEMRNIEGVIHSIDGDIVTVIPDKSYELLTNVQYSAHDLAKRFSDGDHAKVVNGLHKDESGLVLKVENNIVTLLSDTTFKPIEVFSKDLRSATEATAIIPSTSQYELHDLVQLGPNDLGVIVKMEKDAITLLDPFGTVIKVKPQQIRSRRDSGRAVTSDLNGKPITTNDPVMVMDDNGTNKKQAKVLHIFRNSVFLHSRDYAENSGVFVAKSTNVALMTANRGLNGGPGAGSAFANQPRIVSSGGGRPMGRDPLQAKTVTVTGGPFKGYLGIVKDTTETHARVELHTNNRTITIEKEKISVSGEEGSNRSRPNYQASRPAGSRTAYDTGRTPMHMGSKTPAPDDGSGTAWNAAGRTPAWNSGSKTPAWDAGNKTPGYDVSGSKTPAWDSGSKTPAWDSAGSKTPAWDGSGSKTPAWDAGARTPAFTRTQPTPGDTSTPYLSSTPGAFPPTPAQAITPYPNMTSVSQTPSTPLETPGGYRPQTPAVASGSYGSDSTFSLNLVAPRTDWLMADIEVTINSSRRVSSGKYDGQIGIVKSAEGIRAQIIFSSGESIVCVEEYLTPVVPQKKDSFKVLYGEDRGKIGSLLSIDGHEGVVKIEGVDDILMMDLNTLAKLGQSRRP